MKEREGRKEGVDLTKNFHVLEFCIRKQVYTKNVSNLDTVALPRIQPSQKVIYQIKEYLTKQCMTVQSMLQRNISHGKQT